MITGAVLATALLMVLLMVLPMVLLAVIRNDGYGQRPPPPRLGADLGPR
jgi:hypothetical protein